MFCDTIALQHRVASRTTFDGVENMHKLSRFRWVHAAAALFALSVLLVILAQIPAEAQATPAANVHSVPVQIHSLKVTLLSTMLVGSTTGMGEWGFSALVEADGHRI